MLGEMPETKKCIFHLPYRPDPANCPSGTNIRPEKMLSAFKSIGYEVYEIIGDSVERKKKIKELKRRISAGDVFDFVYSESETIPTPLTDPDHIPRHPCLDFNFFKFCRKHGVPVGLFYRDANWLSSDYGRMRQGFKAMLTNVFRRYDLILYSRTLDIMFVPSREFIRLLGKYTKDIMKVELPPACDSGKLQKCGTYSSMAEGDLLQLIYVGGISVKEAYDLTGMLRSLQGKDNVSLTLCVRDYDWENVKDHYSSLLGSNVELVHASGEQLNDLYARADIGMLFYEPSEYRSLAMPIKLFEYLERGVPVIASSDTSAARFVELHGIGWCVETPEKLSSLIDSLLHDRSDLSKKEANCTLAQDCNTWEARAKKVESVLMSRRDNL